MNHYKFLINKNKFIQTAPYNIMGNTTNDISIFPVLKLKFNSALPLTELNLVKAHSRIVLRSFGKSKDLSRKTDTDFIMTSSITNRLKVKGILSGLMLLGKPEISHNKSGEVFMKFTNILLSLKRLDLYKVNINALNTITLSAKTNYNILLNEIFRA